MTRMGAIIASTAFLVLVVLTALAPQGSAQVFKIATLAPEGTTWMNEMRESARSIEEQTGGEVRFRFYPGGVMGSDRNVLRKIRIGQLQGGAVSAAAMAGIYPDSQLYGLPLLFRSYKEVDHVRARMDGVVLKGLEQRGYVAFGIAESGFAYLMSNHPIARVEDLKGLKVWVPEGDPISQTFFEVAGRSPIPLPLSDVLTGLQTGLIETVGTPAIGAIALQWHTAVKYLTDVPLMYTYGMLVMDRRAFHNLKAEFRAIVSEVLEQRSVEVNIQTRKDNERARQVLRKHGIQFLAPAPGETAQLQSIANRANRRLAKEKRYTPDFLGLLKDHLRTYRDKHKVKR